MAVAVEGTEMDIDWERNGQRSQAVFSVVVITAQAQDMFLIARNNLIHATSFDYGDVIAIKNIAIRGPTKMMKGYLVKNGETPKRTEIS